MLPSVFLEDAPYVKDILKAVPGFYDCWLLALEWLGIYLNEMDIVASDRLPVRPDLR